MIWPTRNPCGLVSPPRMRSTTPALADRTPATTASSSERPETCRRPSPSTISAGRGQLGDARRDGLQPFRRRPDRHEVRLGKVAVVEGVLFGAQGPRDPGALVPVAGGLVDGAAGAQHLPLAHLLVGEGTV